MNQLTYEFTQAQRQTLDRYTDFLGSLQVVFNTIPVVFKRRERAGHQLATLAADSRLNNAHFNERSLSMLGECVNEVKVLADRYVDDLAMFEQECLLIMQQRSRREPIDQVDFRLFSLSKSAVWKLFPPQNVRGLIHELVLRFFELRGVVRQLKYRVEELYRESFGLSAVFAKAMDHQTCGCHTQPSVAQELFRDAATTPVWDIAYSSRDASIRATEYKADIASLFKRFASVKNLLGLCVEDLYQRMDRTIIELEQARATSTLGELNFKLGMAVEGANEFRGLLDDVDAWLRK